MSTKGHVLYIGGFEMPDKNAAAHRVVANAKVIQQLNFDVTLVGVTNDIKQERFISAVKQYETLNYYDVKYPTSVKKWAKHIVKISHVKKLIKELNITHVIGYNYPGIALLRLKSFCKKKGIKLFADVTEWYEVKDGSLPFKMVKKVDVFLRMKVVQPKLDGLIVISDFLLDFYKSKTKNIINVPPLVDLSMSKWNTPVEYIKSDKIRLIYAGSPGNGQKDRLDIILEAILELKKRKSLDVSFTIIGITKDQFIENFNITSELKEELDTIVSFKGRLPHLKVLDEIKKADYKVFVRDINLTNQAGFPTKYVEAISSGTPVLTNSSSNISSFYEEGKTGYLLDNSNLVTLVSSLKSIFISENLSKLPVMKQYCRASKKFDIGNFKNDFAKLFENA